MNDAARPDVDAATAAIGARLTDIRMAQRLKVSELARLAGVSPSLISQIERGTSKPSVGTLFAIAQVLNCPVDSFFSELSNQEPPVRRAAAPQAARVQTGSDGGVLDRIRDIQNGEYRLWRQDAGNEREIVRVEDRATLEIRGGVRWERLTPVPLVGVEFLELIYAPGAESDSQAYRHPGIELVLVTSGLMTIFLGFDRHDLRPGDSIAFASSTPHRYVNHTDTESRAVTVILRDDLSRLPIREESADDATGTA
jgi:transcriptional regulator with XRE-family HTH domain